MNQLTTIQQITIWILPVLFAITVHEVAHGWVASKLGDKTAKLLGRLTLNPIKHIDLLGTIIIPALLLILHSGFIFGWAKPVPVNWRNLIHPRRDTALVAIAGPITNLIMALIWAAIGKIAFIAVTNNLNWMAVFVYMGQAGIMINLVLMVLNLIPIPPLDGSRVISSLLPPQMGLIYSRIEPYGFFILLLLLLFHVLGYIIGPPVIILTQLISAIFGL